MNPIRLGPWTLESPLGRGGMGVVWRAKHTSLGLPAAVKVVGGKAMRADPEPDALRAEVAAAARLLHPGILLIYDQGNVTAEAERCSDGRLRAGRPWFTMELASGGTLARHALSMSWPALSDALLALLDALGHAHARGVIHRDLKPANVLLSTASDLRPGWKLSDFGIATAGPTSDRQVRGTPRYMAPEQFRADSAQIGPWTDLYALGCLAWEAVTGAPPFHAQDPTRLALEHLYDAPGAFEPHIPVPSDLEGWLRRLLEKDPADRFRKAADAAWALAGLEPAATVLPTFAEHPSAPAIETTLDDLELDPTTLPDDGAATLDGLILMAGAAPQVQPAPRMPIELPPIPEGWRNSWHGHDLPPTVAASPHLFGLRAIPVVGRVAEQDRLWTLLREVHAARALRVVVLRGPEGSGRSALAAWLTERASEVGAAEVLVASHTRSPTDRDGLVPMFARHLRVTGLDADRTTDALARELRRRDVRDPAEVAALGALLAHRDEGEHGAWTGTDERHALLARLLALLARERPMVVWLDDAHEAADAVDWVSWLHQHMADRLPVLVVLTAAADEGTALGALQELRQRPGVHTEDVRPLPAAALRELIDRLLTLDLALADRVVRAARGSPLYVVQLLGDWIDRGALIAGPAGLILHPEEPDRLPSDLRAITAGRVNRLLGAQPIHARGVLEVAAALGETIDMGEWREATALTRLPFTPALANRLVHDGLALPTDTGWRFAHRVVREVIEEGSRAAGRWPKINLACGRMLEARKDHPGRWGRVGHHLAHAEQPDRALSVLLEAARRRMLKDEARLAEVVLDEAERVADELKLPPTDGRSAALRLLRARTEKARHALDAAWTLVRQVEEDAQLHGWQRLEAESLAEQGDIARVRGDLPLALRRLRRALTRYESLGDDQGIADTLRSLSAVSLHLGALDVAERLLRRARERYADLGDRFGLGMCLAGLGDIARARGHVNDAMQLFRASLAQLRALGHRSGEAMSLHGLAEVQRMTGDLDAAEAGYRQVIRLDLQLGRDNSVSRLNLALCQLERGAPMLAEPTLSQLEVAWRMQSRPGYLAIVHVAWTVCMASRGMWAAMRERLDEALPLLETCSLVERDLARMAELAGDIAAEGSRGEAVKAWKLALGQWTTLGAKEDAERVVGKLGVG